MKKKLIKLALCSILISSSVSATMVMNALEEIPLKELKIYDMKDRGTCGWRATIIDSKNFAYKVEVGDFMGKNRGKVVKMELGKIYLEEIVPDGNGGWTKKIVIFSDTASTFMKKFKEDKVD